MAKIALLGAGMMGTAFTWPLVDRGHEVRLVGTHLDEEIISELKKGRPHPKLKLDVPQGVRSFAVDELEGAMADADLIALGVSSAGVRWAAKKIAPFVKPGTPIVMVSKGLDFDGTSLHVLPDVLARELPESLRGQVFPVGVAGPCIAGELARRVDTCVVFTGRGAEELAAWRDAARGAYYRVFASPDVSGVEACAALKNAFAMGVGFAAGVHERHGGEPGSIAMHNYEAAVFAQAVLEMGRVAALAGGDKRHAYGLAGAGDLNVTCNGGRTGRFGRWLGRGLSLEEAIAKMEGATLECLEILAVMRQALKSFDARGITRQEELPLLRHLCDVAEGRAVEMPFERFFGDMPQ